MNYNIFTLLCFISVSFFFYSQTLELTTSLSNIAQQISNNTFQTKYSLTTQEGYNMDCLKIIYLSNGSKLGIFHSSKDYNDSYNRLYSAIQYNEGSKFQILSRLSDRGSQGTIFAFNPNISKKQYQKVQYKLFELNSEQQPILIAYQLQNHQHGNTYALRYYQDLQHLQINNFLYQYQLQQKVDNARVRNIGTPSIQSILNTKKQPNFNFNSYILKVKFHYSPDGSHDLPGYGTVNLNPLRDFVDKSGKWIGGCKQNYSDWRGSTDQNVLNSFRKLGVTGKIGQRDMFYLQNSGKINKYYFYQANLYSDFNWKNWRIFLYGQTQNQVIPIPFVFDKVFDIANPHITMQKRQGSTWTFQMFFFLPSQGMQPGSDATPGQMVSKTRIIL